MCGWQDADPISPAAAIPDAGVGVGFEKRGAAPVSFDDADVDVDAGPSQRHKMVFQEGGRTGRGAPPTGGGRRRRPTPAGATQRVAAARRPAPIDQSEPSGTLLQSFYPPSFYIDR